MTINKRKKPNPNQTNRKAASTSARTLQRPLARIALLPVAQRRPHGASLLLDRSRRGHRLAAVLAVGAAELGARVGVWVLVPADVAEVAPAKRRRLLSPRLLVGLHGRHRRASPLRQCRPRATAADGDERRSGGHNSVLDETNGVGFGTRELGTARLRRAWGTGRAFNEHVRLRLTRGAEESGTRPSARRETRALRHQCGPCARRGWEGISFCFFRAPVEGKERLTGEGKVWPTWKWRSVRPAGVARDLAVQLERDGGRRQAHWNGKVVTEKVESCFRNFWRCSSEGFQISPLRLLFFR